MKCPHCNDELSAEEIKSLWAEYCRSIKTDKRSQASRENGKRGGRPLLIHLKDMDATHTFCGMKKPKLVTIWPSDSNCQPCLAKAKGVYGPYYYK